MEDAAKGEGGEGDTEEVLAPPDQREDGVQQAE
jgi:hypothetical protein